MVELTQDAAVERALAGALDPDHVVVVGASNRPSNAGLAFVRALRAAHFPGRLSVVNRNSDTVLDAAGYQELAALPSVADLAIIALPSDRVSGAVEEAARCGVKAVHVFSGDFAERGVPDRAARQQQLARIADAAGMAMIGPNCMGIYRPAAGLAFRADQPMLAGNVSLVSQSGGVAIAAVHQLAARGIGVSTVVSFGNAAQLGAGRISEAISVHGEADLVGVYVESANEPDLLDRLARIAKSQRVVLFVGPTSPAGVAASARHTGAPGGVWPGADEIPSGVTLVSSLEAFVGAMTWFASDPCPGPAPAVAFVTISGGIGVLAASELERNGVRLAQLSDETRAEIEDLLPGGLIVARNPVDLGVSYLSRKVIARTLAALRTDPNVELTLFHLIWDHLVDVDRQSPGYAEGFLRLLIDHACQRDDLAVFFPRMVDDENENSVRRRLRQAGIRVLESIHEVADALKGPIN